MKKQAILAATLLLVAGGLMAQDQSSSQPDTVKIGKYIIIKKTKPATDGSAASRTVEVQERKKKSGITTNWSILDIGFANVRDETVYGSPEANAYLQGGAQHFTRNDMKLRASKTSNINYWLFMQRVNVSKQVLNIKYGLGLEMYNFRYSTNISYRQVNGNAFVFRDTVQFSKNKLYAGYITVPFMVNLNLTPNKERGFSVSAGVSAGYLVGSRNKQVSAARGKEKERADFDLEKWRLAYVAELGLGPVRLYGSYSINPLHQRGLTQYPYAMGIRLSSF